MYLISKISNLFKFRESCPESVNESASPKPLKFGESCPQSANSNEKDSSGSVSLLMNEKVLETLRAKRTDTLREGNKWKTFPSDLDSPRECVRGCRNHPSHMSAQPLTTQCQHMSQHVDD